MPNNDKRSEQCREIAAAWIAVGEHIGEVGLQSAGLCRAFYDVNTPNARVWTAMHREIGRHLDIERWRWSGYLAAAGHFREERMTFCALLAAAAMTGDHETYP